MVRVPRVKNVIIMLLAFFFATEMLAGPLRHFLSQAGYPELIYLPKIAFAVGVFVYFIYMSFVKRKTHVAFIVIGAIVLWGGLFGYV